MTGIDFGQRTIGGGVCVIGLLAICVLVGCEKSQNAADSPPVKTAASPAVAGAPASAEDHAEAGVGNSAGLETGGGGLQSFDGMKFDVPADWSKQTLSQMQIGIISAKFGIPSISDDISLTLSTSGGSLEDNIGRWEGQFSGGDAPRRETISIDGKDATVVRLSGRFSPGFGRPSEDGWCMTGVIIPMTGHNYYVKLTGPQADVSMAEEAFLKFCRSARPE